MPKTGDLVLAAREIKKQLNGHAFLTMPRTGVTNLVRVISGEETTRIKPVMAAELEKALLNQGVRSFPSMVTTTTGDMIRFFHAGSLLGNLVDMLAYPSDDTDKELAEAITKQKGKWNATHVVQTLSEGGAAPTN